MTRYRVASNHNARTHTHTGARLAYAGNPNLDPFVVDIQALYEDPDNARQHDERNLSTIVDSLRTFGQQKPIVIDSHGCIVAGNGTFAAARALGWERIAAVVTDLDHENARRAYAIADNRTAELADWNFPALSAGLSMLPDDLRALVGFQPEEIEILTRAEWSPPPTGDDDDSNGEESADDKHTITLSAEAHAAFALVKASMRDDDDSAAVVRLCRMWERGTE